MRANFLSVAGHARASCRLYIYRNYAAGEEHAIRQ
jgi:hypothetical protein